jgi:hypothetical protein
MRGFIRFAVVLNVLVLFALIAVAAAPAQTDEPFTLGGLLERFWNDGKVDWIVLLVVLDFLLGVFVALKARTFRLSYIADFLRKDVIFKIGGYLVIYAGAVYAGEAEILGVPELDLGLLAGGAYAVVLAAMAGSIFNSVAELGLIPGGGGGEDPPVDPAPSGMSVKGMLTADEGI